MNGIDDFYKFFKTFIGLIVAGVATTALVLVTALIDIAPPWPVAIVQITAIVQLIALVLVYQMLSKANRNTINRKMKNNLLFLLIFAILYFSLFSLLIFKMPNEDIGVKGLFCSVDAYNLFADTCPFLQEAQIATANYEAEKLWTPLGITASRILLLIAWIGSFATLVNLFACFVVYQHNQASVKKAG
ncbi:hypothetical protein K1W69_24485 [Hoeflea sp. WL0058]|uniref:Uncharacterized protein n=1 Tax=Flavimaribacter sediminis TaxID=2865987 RepID=A0AAE3D3R6_9HYPH|nr:hypothetical protein [Flavimaribacter sediminis]MBW8640372.1 hypothetical protein [Flavimaribacter sediminis]